MRQFAVIIPARLDSIRLPSKMLLSETGKPLIRHTAENASKMGAEVVAVASDSAQILDAVEHDALTIFTGDHRNGTERLAEAVQARELADYEHFVNIQGDEPLLPEDAAAAALEALEWAACGTVASRNLDVVDRGTRLCLSDPNPDASDCPFALKFDRVGVGLLHHGVYAYRRRTLEWYAKQEPTTSERRFKLEQYRFLEHSRQIAYKKIAYRGDPIDDRGSYDDFVEQFTQGLRP